jgi:signal transduction histidine kinase
VTAQDRERRRLERDIHDGAQQQLVALAINLKVARALAATDPTGARTTIEEQLSAVTEAIDTLSDLSRGLLPDVLAEQGLAAALTRVTVGNPVPVSVSCAGLPRLSADLEATLYFCALEAVQNATKHAGARRIDVRVEWEQGRLSLLVEDDGTGFDPRTEEGTGLANIRERVGALGGTLRLTSGRREGTAVRVDVPVDAPGVQHPAGPGAT